MNYILKSVSTILLILTFYTHSYSQGYTTALGIRLGTEWGVTINQVVYDKISLEGIYQSGFLTPQYGFTALGKFHNSIAGRRINMFYGGGFHKYWEKGNEKDFVAGSGITLIVGAEISIGNFNISYDFKPAINVFSGSKKFDAQTALSLRYVLVKKVNWAKKKRKKKRAKRKKNRKPLFNFKKN